LLFDKEIQEKLVTMVNEKPVIAVSTYAAKGFTDVTNKREKVTVTPTII